MTTIYDDPRLIQTLDELDSETTEACIRTFLATVSATVPYVVRQLNNAHAEFFVEINQVKIVFNRFRTLEMKVKPYAPLPFGGFDVSRATHEQ